MATIAILMVIERTGVYAQGQRVLVVRRVAVITPGPELLPRGEQGLYQVARLHDLGNGYSRPWSPQTEVTKACHALVGTSKTHESTA